MIKVKVAIIKLWILVKLKKLLNVLLLEILVNWFWLLLFCLFSSMWSHLSSRVSTPLKRRGRIEEPSEEELTLALTNNNLIIFIKINFNKGFY